MSRFLVTVTASTCWMPLVWRSTGSPLGDLPERGLLELVVFSHLVVLLVGGVPQQKQALGALQAVLANLPGQLSHARLDHLQTHTRMHISI